METGTRVLYLYGNIYRSRLMGSDPCTDIALLFVQVVPKKCELRDSWTIDIHNKLHTATSNQFGPSVSIIAAITSGIGDFFLLVLCCFINIFLKCYHNLEQSTSERVDNSAINWLWQNTQWQHLDYQRLRCKHHVIPLSTELLRTVFEKSVMHEIMTQIQSMKSIGDSVRLKVF